MHLSYPSTSALKTTNSFFSLLPFSLGPIVDLLARKAYVAGYDRRLRHPAWTAEHLTAASLRRSPAPGSEGGGGGKEKENEKGWKRKEKGCPHELSCGADTRQAKKRARVLVGINGFLAPCSNDDDHGTATPTLIGTGSYLIPHRLLSISLHPRPTSALSLVEVLSPSQ